ncbi:MAG TPA: DUF190 domain-containing protein [Gaiellaceae bacterium]|nr:DUF190 domain-containing protein [Gaiellaceae bacterium]
MQLTLALVAFARSRPSHGRDRHVRERGLAGATVQRGIEGFGAHPRIDTTRILRLTEDLPVVIEIVDQAERVNAVLPALDEMIGEA